MRPLVAIATLAVAIATLIPCGARAAAVPAPEPILDDKAQSPWSRGRATFYGHDGYSIDDGACMYGDIPFPYYVGALSDWLGDNASMSFNTYQHGNRENNMCGTCFEVQCDPSGPYGGDCRSDRVNASVIVRITDRCPCDHPNPSNKKWCCGDAPHFDLSYDAFGEIGSHGGGVISLQWRQVQCPDTVGFGGELAADPIDWTPFCSADAIGGGNGDSLGGVKKTLANAADAHPHLTTFAEALWRAGPDVWAVMSTKNHQHTVVAPTNAAFEAFAAGMNLTVPELLDGESLTEIMKYHVLHNAVNFTEGSTACDDIPPSDNSCAQEKAWGNCVKGVTFVDERKSNATLEHDFKRDGYCRQTCGFCDDYSTLAGIPLSVTPKAQAKRGRVLIADGREGARGKDGDAGARIVNSMDTCNGNLIVIDRVLYPLCMSGGAKSLLQVADERNLTRFVQAVYKAETVKPGVLGIGRGFGLYTLLAPQDKAFESFLSKQRKQTWEQFIDADDFLDVMKGHVMHGRRRIGYYEDEDECRDTGVPADVAEGLPLPPALADANASVIACEDVKPLGFCADSWTRQGDFTSYCRKTCGLCHTPNGSHGKGEGEGEGVGGRNITYSLSGAPLLLSKSRQALEPRRNLAEGSSGLDPNVTAGGPAYLARAALGKRGGGDGGKGGERAAARDDGALVVLPDLKACNGLLNVIDSVLIAS